MAGETLSTSMRLIIPAVGTTAGPQWATDINNSLTIVDGHNHTPGYGVAIPSAGLNINADLSFSNNNATNLRSTRYQPQSAVLTLSSDLNCTYSVGLDLYYNDGAGNNVRITQNGAIAGTPGSISNLVPPASAAYNGITGTFVFQSGVNIAANLDVASIVLRNQTTNSFGLTLAPPNSMASDTTITLPQVPAQTSVMTMTSSGSIGFASPNLFVATGTTITFSGSSIPSGYLPADGSAVSRSTYANLFSVISTTYGPGDGSTTFNVPSAPIQYFSGVNSIPNYVQSYWKMGQASGGEPNFATTGGVYDLFQNGSIMPAAGFVSPIGSRGVYSSNNYFSVPLLNSNTTPYDSPIFAFGGWIKLASAGSVQYIASKSNGSGGWVVSTTSTNDINFTVNGTDHITSGIDVADGQWHLIYVCILSTGGASNLRIYVDNQVRYIGGGVTYPPSPNDFWLGRYSGGGFNGYLTLIEFWNSVPATWSQFELLINQRWNGGAGRDYIAQIAQLSAIKT